MTINIEHQHGYRFNLKINDINVELSYKSCGGRKSIEELGVDGVSALLNDAITEFRVAQCQKAISCIFSTFGVSNAMRIIEHTIPEEFVSYFLNTACALHHIGEKASFRETLRHISGTKATLNHNNDDEYIRRLISGCDDIVKGSFYPEVKVIKPGTIKINSDYGYTDARYDGIEVAFWKKGNNTIHYMVNGIEVTTCCNRIYNKVDTNLVLDIALYVRETIHAQSSLVPLTKKWGGTFIFRLMRAVCEDDAYLYFQKLAEKLTESRQKVEPRKILKEHHYTFSDRENAAFISSILSVMEKVKNNETDNLISSNKNMLLSNNDVWSLYYPEGKNAKLRKLDFTGIKTPGLRQQAKDFLRDRFLSEDELKVTQLARYFYCLHIAANILSPRIHSIGQVKTVDARLIKSTMEAEGKSANDISETIMVVQLMFDWQNPEEDLDNPFENVRIPNKGNFAEVTPAARDEAIDLINEHFDELPECVQLAFLLFLTTYSRGNDIFALSVNSIMTTEDGRSVIESYSGKNGKFGRDEISSYLAGRLYDYIKKTQNIRDEMGTDIILVYKDERSRLNSSRCGRILNPAKFSYHINKMLDKYASSGKVHHITARSIRAYGGRKMQTEGMSEMEKSMKLKNTPKVSRKHYSDITDIEQAHNNARLLSATFRHLFEPDPEKNNYVKTAPTTVLFGKCNSQNKCRHTLSCTACVLKMIRRED